MRTSGQAHEGWMSVIPLAVLVFIASLAFGGPEASVKAVASFAADAIAYLASCVRSL